MGFVEATIAVLLLGFALVTAWWIFGEPEGQELADLREEYADLKIQMDKRYREREEYRTRK